LNVLTSEAKHFKHNPSIYEKIVVLYYIVLIQKVDKDFIGYLLFLKQILHNEVTITIS